MQNLSVSHLSYSKIFDFVPENIEQSPSQYNTSIK